jgi:hypothetical protein
MLLEGGDTDNGIDEETHAATEFLPSDGSSPATRVLRARLPGSWQALAVTTPGMRLGLLLGALVAPLALGALGTPFGLRLVLVLGFLALFPPAMRLVNRRRLTQTADIPCLIRTDSTESPWQLGSLELETTQPVWRSWPEESPRLVNLGACELVGQSDRGPLRRLLVLPGHLHVTDGTHRYDLALRQSNADRLVAQLQP